MPICCDCGEEYPQKRASLNYKNCVDCSQLNDRHIYQDMSRRIVPAAHKGHLTYVPREANREFISTMMKK